MGVIKDKTGEKRFNNDGQMMEVVKYRRYADIDIKFDDDVIVCNRHYGAFKNGNIKKPICRVGEKLLNNSDEMMEIIEYRKYSDIDIQFEDGTIIYNRQYIDFTKGEINNPNTPSVCKVGFVGVGKYETSKNNIQSPIYTTWRNMIMRCYDEKCLKKCPTYFDCSVCRDWLNFQNFAEWYSNNIWSEDCMQLDKDILFKGNKVYSPETCIFVDHRINCLFTKRDIKRGEYPIGVCKYGNKFMAGLSQQNKKENIGIFSTPELAFMAYKKEKEQYIKQIADEYKARYQKFPDKLYRAMVNYSVEITD